MIRRTMNIYNLQNVSETWPKMLMERMLKITFVQIVGSEIIKVTNVIPVVCGHFTNQNTLDVLQKGKCRGKSSQVFYDH